MPKDFTRKRISHNGRSYDLAYSYRFTDELTAKNPVRVSKPKTIK